MQFVFAAFIYFYFFRQQATTVLVIFKEVFEWKPRLRRTYTSKNAYSLSLQSRKEVACAACYAYIHHDGRIALERRQKPVIAKED
jgi:hypothetical protein